MGRGALREIAITVGRSVSTAVLGLLLPKICAACEVALDDDEHGLICGRCWARVRTLGAPQCVRCGHPARGRACAWCAFLPPYVRAVRSCCWAGSGTGRAIVHALKYGGWEGVACEMAARMGRLPWPRDVVRERALLVPVPLAPVRERERGFNQSALLAMALGPRWDVPVACTMLDRIRATESQTRLTPGERRRNVSGAFRAAASAQSALRGAHIVLVDDVVTTAATLNACASALRAGGARIVSYVTFGRAPAVGDRY
ncbi:MAG: ComF family protein [Gemmatimonadaceae bacterium]